MSLLNLLRPRPAPTRIGPTLLLDALVSETHERRSQVTDFPVETGGSIADHIRNEPRQVSVEGFVTNSPVRLLGGALERVSRGTPTGGDQVEGAGLDFAEQALAELERIHDARELVEVVSPRRRYQNMAMLSLVVPRDPATGAALRFSATFREVTRVDSRTVELRVRRTAERRSQPKSDKGKQTPTEPTEKMKDRVSALRRLQAGATKSVQDFLQGGG